MPPLSGLETALYHSQNKRHGRLRHRCRPHSKYDCLWSGAPLTGAIEGGSPSEDWVLAIRAPELLEAFDDVAHAGSSADQLDRHRQDVLRFVAGDGHQLFEQRG